MSKKVVKKKKVVVSSDASSTGKKKISPTVSRSKSNVSASKALIFNQQNYQLMALGALLVGIGLLLMTGGSQPDPNTWDPDIIYSKRITVLGPVVILAGLILEIYAIFKK